ncbi:hypothetical protein MM213_15685 [Belliella sp. R4-6]|uniref:PorV/PorQ family protein n=1 Tax=Belliella alkalica TaxID=1730871 RepID=A0ABS9VET4_9BACT|nr:hypothetical protein [Belliella alkalica]MCH7414942.1 hypothetical protein [Belliella alkalica]
MVKVLLSIILVCFSSLRINAQSGIETLPKGARSMSMGNANLTIADSWSLFNNIGALGRLESSSAMVGYDHRFNLNELTTIAAGVALHTEKFRYGISASSFGGEHFNQNTLGIGIANQLGIASLGLKINYFQTNIDGFGRTGSPVIEFGGMAELSPNLFFGAHIYNLSNSKLSKNSFDRIPTVVRSGISYRPSEKLMVNIEAEKDILLDPLIKLGLEYNLMDRLWMRSGFNTNPSNLFFGIGFRPRNFVIDYAMTQNQYLGNTHHFSFGYLFQKK